MSRSGLAATFAVAAALSGCPAPQGDGAPDAAGRHTHEGVKVPLPSGWVVHSAADQTFRAGPPGRTVLRIEARPAQARLPSPESLRDMFIQEDKEVQAKVHSQVSRADTCWVVLEVTRRQAHAAVLLGVRRSGKEWFFCASEPGSTDAEVLKAAAACEGLTVP